jgi:FAD dependent oxidoreductase
VIVVGSGSAGSIAAIAAARNGARTLLVERYGFLGGTSTCVLDTFYGFYTPGTRSLKVVGGLADEVVNGLKQFDCCFQRPNTYGAGTGITYNSEYLKVVWERLVRGAGVDLLLHCWMQGAEFSGGRIDSVSIATKQGPKELRARYFVDASGDADLCFYTGVPFEPAGKFETAQVLTTTFKVANVDVEARKKVSKKEFHEHMRRAAESGAYRLPRWEGSDHVTPVAGMMATNMTRVQSFEIVGQETRNATDPVLLSNAETEGREQALEYLRFLRNEIDGYGKAELVAFSTQIGVRETRRLMGLYRLTREDVLSARQFDDQVGLCGAPIEDHHGGSDTAWKYLPDGECVGIPYRTLLPQKLENLVVAGRCFSATHDAQASVRSMAQCMAMGQAAGTAAALCAGGKLSLPELKVGELQDRLRRDLAILAPN